ncbi:MAG: ABC transporter substrate-binding protein [Elainellaceae cyanobacterium]
MVTFKQILRALILAGLTLGLITCAQGTPVIQSDADSEAIPEGLETVAVADDKLTIWWTQGFLPEENEVIVQLVADWEQASGFAANLVLLPDRDILGDTQRAIEEERSPDVVFSFPADTNLFPRLAWLDQLADVSHLVEPIQDTITPTALESVYYQNNVTQTRSYYALPFGQNTVHLHYWQPLLNEAGLYNDEIPNTWNEFWQFWQTAHAQLRDQGIDTVYGIGLCLSDLGTDTFWQFEQFLEARNLELVDEQGTLRIDDPGIRQGLIDTIQQFVGFYRDGYIPPAAVEWTDSGNNISFLEQQSLMTVNSTLSVPFSQRQPDTPYNRQSTDYYFNQIRTIPWPNKPDGSPHRSILSIKQLAILKDTDQLEAAESFAAYFIQPANIDKYLQLATKGRIFPVIRSLWQDPFWNAVNDPHLSLALQQHQQDTRPSYQVYAPAYSKVLQDNVWAKAILQVLNDGVSPEQATDQAIARVKQIFGEWS